MNDRQNDKSGKDHDPGPGFLDVMLSVMAAAFGVQNSKNRERDFTHGNPLAFIAAGLIVTLLFILTIVGVVNLIL